jgi:VWFA-related protein
VNRTAIALVATLAFAQTFRTETDLVSISTSVKRGNAAVANLTPADFRVTDNGVAQTIELLTVESVPIDVTLFLDTSGSTSGVLGRMRKDLGEMTGMLRPTDRFRVLTIGLTVDETVPWQAAGAPIDVNVPPVQGISLIYDALFVALSHRPQPGRRHLVVALTDGEDCGSVLDGPAILDACGRTEAVLHFIYAHGSAGFNRNGVAAWCTPRDGGSVRFVKDAAGRTGGSMHNSMFGDPAVREFRTILDEFRTSYVLRYSPRGVARDGWHAVVVDVPAMHGVTVHARSGYFVAR